MAALGRAPEPRPPAEPALRAMVSYLDLMPTIEADALERSIGEVLEAAGCPPDPAAIVAESLVLSNLKGMDSHGLIRVTQYVAEIESGRTLPGRDPNVTERDGQIHVDGRWGFGAVGARLAARLAAERARDSGVSLVTLSNVNHVGRLGETVERVAVKAASGSPSATGARRAGGSPPSEAGGRSSGRIHLHMRFPTRRGADRRRLLHGDDSRRPRAPCEAE